MAFCAKFKKFAFLPKCIISAKYFLSYSKTNLEKFWFRFYGPKNASFLFFIFLLWRLSNHFFMKKPTIFITNIKSTHSSYIFTMIWHLETFGNETLKKKQKKLRFLTSDFDKCRKKKILNFTNFSNMVRGTAILKDCDIASYSCWNYGPSNLLF